MYNAIRTSIKKFSRENRRNLEPVISTLESLSPGLEKLLRRKLDLLPEVVTFVSTPLGNKLSSPIRMSTCFGRDQVSKAVYYHGWSAYEHPLLALFTAAVFLAKDGLFLDIGANTGIYSLLVRTIRPSMGAHAFEPFPPVAKVLRDNVALSGFVHEIAIIECAVSNVAAIADLFIPTQEHGLVEMSASLSQTFKSRHSEIVKVPTIRVDDYCLSYQQNISLIKIDVEGTEDLVLQGAIDTITRCRPLIVCEIFNTSKTWPQMKMLLESCSYRLASVSQTSVRVCNVPDETSSNYLLFHQDEEGLVQRTCHLADLEFLV